MELEQREGTMAAVGFEEFSAPPGSELALPPLFGGHILESELETEVEFVSGGLGDSGLRERDEEEEAARGRRRRQRELNRRKYQALGRRCREIEQVNERVLNRLHQVQRITRRLQQERRFLMNSSAALPALLKLLNSGLRILEQEQTPLLLRRPHLSASSSPKGLASI